ncbi:transcriptional regulator, LysR family [Poseidonocella pacifica]|uniref:Transcriptional regulator, LysR family n=1 Tax=Poseidonocella pacifica TaxID=871651 RepID=A0A1I0XFV6_9RHOB|nr:LysR family transcriptional regulator [Poseidonocella pacifica]SFA99180.1 transcriptional regulator, LysR family [Poseidonocella pacifica]
MLTKGVTLRGLEVFSALASTGSVAQTAEVTGLSQPAVSQQLRNLESALGIALVNHGRRPMVPTPAGRSFLVRVDTILNQLRIAQGELSVMDLSHLSTLSLGVIDDFDNDLTPRLVTILAENLTRCRFKLVTAPSHEITDMLTNGRLHIAVAATTGIALEGVVEYPLLRDPFLLVTPKGTPIGPDPLMDLAALPFLRYDREQLIGRQIEAQLAQHGIQFSERFEIGAHLSLMTLASRNVGWTITTALGFMRAARMHDALDAHPLPFKPFARGISLFASADWADRVPRDVARTMRHLLLSQSVDPALKMHPWLADDLCVLDE